MAGAQNVPLGSWTLCVYEPIGFQPSSEFIALLLREPPSSMPRDKGRALFARPPSNRIAQYARSTVT